jgi:hypothetical protein
MGGCPLVHFAARPSLLSSEMEMFGGRNSIQTTLGLSWLWIIFCLSDLLFESIFRALFFLILSLVLFNVQAQNVTISAVPVLNT